MTPRLRALVLAALAVAPPALAQLTSTATPVLGTHVVAVDERVHLQTNPHVSGDFVVYTDFSTGGQILLKNLGSTAAPVAVPRPDGISDRLSDISGDTLVFQRVTAGAQSIYAATLQADGTPGTPFAVAPDGSQLRSRAALGGVTVAFEDLSFSAGSPIPEISVADVSNPSAAPVRITSDALSDEWPAVSPDGKAVVFQKCATPGQGCTIARAARSSGGTWVVTQLTTPSSPAPASGISPSDTLPTTNGELVVYGSNRSGEENIWIAEPNGAGGYNQFYLDRAGHEWRPTISREFIAFEGGDTRAGPFDIFLFHRRSSTLYQLTTTDTVDETLTDLSVSPDGLVRVVWAQKKNGDARDYDVYALSAVIATPSPCEDDDDDDADLRDPVELCKDAEEDGRPELISVEITRTTGATNSVTGTFASDGDEGLLCVLNCRATSGQVSLNGQREIGPDSFKHASKLIARKVDLAASNTLALQISGQKGTSYVARVYGELDRCAASDGGVKDSTKVAASLRDVSARTETVKLVRGAQASVLEDGTRVIEAAQLSALGCSSTQGGAGLGALALVAVWLLSLRRPAAVRVRRRR